MPGDWKVKLINLCYKQATDNDRLVFSYLFNSLAKYGPKTDKAGNIIISKVTADNYPVFCAHIDTIHYWANNFKLFQYDIDGHNYLIARDGEKKHGIGGDDKCGVFACLYLLETLENVKIVFFTGEETGCTGSYNIDMSEFEGARFICSIDRWGNSDLISSYFGEKTISDKFKKEIAPLLKKHSYKHTSGLITDCFTLMERGANVSCFNISCGYYSHHSNEEYIDTNELWDCCLLCEEIARTCDEVYEHKGRYNYKLSDSPVFEQWKLDRCPDEELKGIISYIASELGYTVDDMYFTACIKDIVDSVNDYLFDFEYKCITDYEIIKFRDGELIPF